MHLDKSFCENRSRFSHMYNMKRSLRHEPLFGLRLVWGFCLWGDDASCIAQSRNWLELHHSESISCLVQCILCVCVFLNSILSVLCGFVVIRYRLCWLEAVEDVEVLFAGWKAQGVHSMCSYPMYTCFWCWNFYDESKFQRELGQREEGSFLLVKWTGIISAYFWLECEEAFVAFWLRFVEKFPTSGRSNFPLHTFRSIVS